LYSADSQLRIWEIGTHHEYVPDEASWDKVLDWLRAGMKASDRSKLAVPDDAYMYADFLVCPTEPFKKGSVQHATIKSASNRRYRDYK
jgi:hypothetical protein